MKVFSLPHSPFSARVRMQIYYKDLPIEIVPPPGFKTPEYEHLNVIGKIPALQLDNGTVIPESGTILQYLEDVYPQPSLRPADPQQRAIVHMLGMFSDTYIQPALLPLFTQFFQRGSDEQLRQLVGTLNQQMQVLDQLLVQYDRIGHNQLDLADIMFGPTMFFAEDTPRRLGMSGVLDGCPNVQDWWDWISSTEVGSKVNQEMAEGLEIFLAKLGA